MRARKQITQPSAAKDAFAAARSGDLEVLRAHLERGFDPAARNPHGFTALQCAAMGCNTLDEAPAVATIDMLLKAGSPVEARGPDGRTALYLAAEFSRTLGPVKSLIEAGASPESCNTHGHIVTCAMLPQVKQYLSELTGHPIPPPRRELKPVKLGAAEWRAARQHLDRVFDLLAQAGLVVLQDAGTTQEDGFADCAHEYHDRGDTRLLGFCFYTRQDLNRAKSTSLLSLAFWGAPDGRPDAMLRVGELITGTFVKNGFTVDWNGSPSIRPAVYLQNIGQGSRFESSPPPAPPPPPPQELGCDPGI